jgi:4-amino-4-deoxy-L-arabinose transferase-like glycosyltransferase
LTGELRPSTSLTWWIFWLAAGSFLPFIFLQYVGEEAVYTILAQETWANKEFTVTTLYGSPYGRASAYAWLIVMLTRLLGADNILIAARLISMASTVLMGLTLAWLVRSLFRDWLFAAFSAVVFLSGDVLLYRGWLAYSDPCFSFFTFAAMACLWVATQERRHGLLLVALLALLGSFLAKALTGYVFYGVLGLVLVWRHQNRMFLLSPLSLLVHIAAVGCPLFWDRQVASIPIMRHMTEQILLRLDNPDLPDFVGAVEFLALYPLQIVWLLLPLSVLTLYALLAVRFRSRTSARLRSLSLSGPS